MAKKHVITAIELDEIKATRKNNKDKKIDKRLQVLELYADNLSSQSISELTGYNRAYINAIVNKYIKNGLSALVDNHYSGNHRLLSYAEEAELLAPFIASAEAGQLVSVSEITSAYEKAIGRELNSNGHIYQVLKRHRFRKVMPRSKHPNKASDAVIHSAKKLTLAAKN